jgi:hypothetical protein
MGAAQSSNASSSVANVSNFVTNSTTANSSQTNLIANSIRLNNCDIKVSGDFDINTKASVKQTSKQVATAIQNANLQNNIQQQCLQEATSKLGFLGVGYASASNSTNQVINSTNDITNAITTTSNQYANTKNQLTCNRSTITAGSINIDFKDSSEMMSDQTLQNNQVARLVNTVTQMVTQKATAVVEGLGALILAFFLIAAVVVYGISKPLSSGSAKVVVQLGLSTLLLGIGSFMYIRETPPFFAPPSECINNSAIGMGTGDSIPSCINSKQTDLQMPSPPTKYVYCLIPGGISKSGGNLLQIAIASAAGNSVSNQGNNGGYRIDIMNDLQTKIRSYSSLLSDNNINIPNIPNPLKNPSSTSSYYKIPPEYMIGGICTPGILSVGSSTDPTEFNKCPSRAAPSAWDSDNMTTSAYLGVANLNLQEWQDYLNMNPNGRFAAGVAGYVGNDESIVRALFARFALCDITGNIELHHYIYSKEFIKYLDKDNNAIVKLAGSNDSTGKIIPNDTENTYLYTPSSFNNYVDGISGTGKIGGMVGVIDDRQYRFSGFMQSTGGSIMLVIVVGIFIFMIFSGGNKKKDIVNPLPEGVKS